jgi:hypothetical protein
MLFFRNLRTLQLINLLDAINIDKIKLFPHKNNSYYSIVAKLEK